MEALSSTQRNHQRINFMGERIHLCSTLEPTEPRHWQFLADRALATAFGFIHPGTHPILMERECRP